MKEKDKICTYLFKDDKYYKIGRSTNVLNRFLSIKANNVNLECVSFTYRDIEKYLHNKFKLKKVYLEWFDLEDNDIKLIIDLFGNPNIDDIIYLNYKITEHPYNNRLLISMNTKEEIFWLKNKDKKEYKYWVDNHLRFINILNFQDIISLDSNNQREEILNYINNCEDLEELVMFLELSALKSGVKTISAMARLEKKSPNGIKQSKAYRKTIIGEQLMCLKGLRDNDVSWL